jgi:hypothetical protein
MALEHEPCIRTQLLALARTFVMLYIFKSAILKSPPLL